MYKMVYNVQNNYNDKKLYYTKDNKEYLFVPINNLENDYELYFGKSYLLNDLPNIIYGKYLDNLTGYNPIGWWKYIKIEKNKLLYK